MEIDFSSSVPLHEQVAAALRRAISEGEAVPGDRLPPARDLAGVLDVNTNTVFRAFRTLRDEGLLDFSRGRHVAVTGDAPDRGRSSPRRRNSWTSGGASATATRNSSRSWSG
jgi:GntR family transcriptional regulator